MFIYKQTEFSSKDGADLWTVGHMEGDKFEPESDHSSKYAAAARCIELNGGGKYVEHDERPAKAVPKPGKGQHTPGPWNSIAYGKTTKGEIIIAGGKEFSNLLAEVYKQKNEDSQEANARLIAAAPELLEALKAILPYAENESASLDEAAKRDGENSEIADEARKAWAAIDQALELIKATEGQQS